MAHQICFQFEDQIQNKTGEKSLLKEIKLLKNVLENERAMWAGESLRSRESVEECKAEMHKMKDMLIAYDTSVLEKDKTNEKTSIKLRDLEEENQTLSLSLRQEKSYSALLQMELSDMKKMLQQLQNDFENLQQNHKEVTALLEREIETNTDLQVKIQHLMEKTMMLEKTCQTSQNYEDKEGVLQEEKSISQKGRGEEEAGEMMAVLSMWRRILLFFICGSYHMDANITSKDI